MNQYTQDEKWKTLMGLREIIQEEIKQLGGHLADKPSTATLNMISELKISNKEFETKQNNMLNEIQEMKQTAKETLVTNNLAHEKIEKAVSDSETNITELFKGLEEKIDKALSKKANKWAEQIWVWIGTVVGGAGLVILIGIIIQAIIHFYRP
jgi:CHASE3 domain sensor protein